MSERERRRSVKLFQENVHMYRHIFFLKLYGKMPNKLPSEKL